MSICEKNTSHIFHLFLSLLTINKFLAQNQNVDSLNTLLKKEVNPEKLIDLRSLISEYGSIERMSYWDSVIKDALAAIDKRADSLAHLIEEAKVNSQKRRINYIIWLFSKIDYL